MKKYREKKKKDSHMVFINLDKTCDSIPKYLL